MLACHAAPSEKTPIHKLFEQIGVIVMWEPRHRLCGGGVIPMPLLDMFLEWSQRGSCVERTPPRAPEGVLSTIRSIVSWRGTPPGPQRGPLHDTFLSRTTPFSSRTTPFYTFLSRTTPFSSRTTPFSSRTTPFSTRTDENRREPARTPLFLTRKLCN